ncbi:RNA polymerase sigma factor SigJ [Paenibacillus chartarius]|uniref:RNA polymerase sigma factor SigJ n=1 Tax=Paenibacillus chartarius TaxID=747481 RepID=A0ABV6DG15_9BACL
MEVETLYREFKPLLFSIAYRMLGSVADAEDAVQETFAAVVSGDGKVANWKAYLCRAVTNRCMDILKSSRRKRELYVGPWLPEPLVQDAGPDRTASDPLQATLLEETVSYAFLVLLQRLTPLERAVFILREAFDYTYRDIADIVGKTELGCRQTYSRVRRKVQGAPEAEAVPDLGEGRVLVERFLQAAYTGDVASLVALLSDDAVLVSDGGGKRFAALQPIVGSVRVAAFLAGVAAKSGAGGSVRFALVNGSAGVVLTAPDGPTVVTFALSPDGRCSRMYLILNPDKLTTLQAMGI